MEIGKIKQVELGKRTHKCATLTKKNVGETVTLSGWVRRRRDHGGLIFVDLGDYTGFCQVVFRPESKAVFGIGESLRSEYVISIRGTVGSRPEGTVNSDMLTGEIEVNVLDAEVLSEAQPPPFLIQDDIDVKEELRLRYRFLDLRRPRMQKLLRLRHSAYRATRAYLDANGFCEIETPVLTKTTPEGARDFIVPSRLSPGLFYALPQSPQLFKQILMCSCFDRYYQIVRCFRDEDLRANRQPEFTQIDMELSFVDEEDVKVIVEGLIAAIWKECLGVNIKLPIQRLTYDQVMNRFGMDAPDMRFGMELEDISELAAQTDLEMFKQVLQSGGAVKGMKLEKGATLSRKELDEIGEFVKNYGAKGISWIKKENGELKSPIIKYFSQATLEKLSKQFSIEDGDIVFVLADAVSVVHASLGALRVELAKRFSLIDNSKLAFTWVDRFPLFEYDKTQGRYLSVHHPFTSPVLNSAEDFELLEKDPGKLNARAYDLVLNGQEIAGGSIRIHRADIQRKVFQHLQIGPEEAEAKFGFLLDAFSYGAPPHGGIALGLDHVIMLLGNTDSIRDVIAFPKNQSAIDLMMEAPSEADPKQLRELSISLLKPKK